MPSCRRRCNRLALLASLLVAGGCAPRLSPLRGAPAPARFPRADLGAGHRKLVFHWELEDGDLVARGEGAARIAPPDSVRLDLFLAGGMGAAAAVLIDGDLRLPGGRTAVRFVPPPPLLWAALGRLAVPPLADTVARIDGSVFRADIGTPVRWRVTFDGGQLRRLERVAGGRVQEWVTRTPDGHIRYHSESDRRTLDLVITRSDETAPFDPTLWTFP
ncbi:MAG: hypothetical protein ACYCVL_12975 [Gemmatimonadaceae bacterium]